MCAPTCGMAPSMSALPLVSATTPNSAMHDDLCVDCFRGGDQLVMELLNAQMQRTEYAGGVVPHKLTGWWAAETPERRRSSASSDDTPGERRRRAGHGCNSLEATVPFRHHLDIDTYIREYRKHREPCTDRSVRRFRRIAENKEVRLKKITFNCQDYEIGSSLPNDTLKLVAENGNTTESKLLSQPKDKERGRYPKEVSVEQLSSPDLQQTLSLEEDVSILNPVTHNALRDCCNIQRVGTFTHPERCQPLEEFVRPAAASTPATAIKLSGSDYLSPTSYHCLTGRRIPVPSQPVPGCESTHVSGIFVESTLRSVHRHPKPAPAPPPTAEPQSRSRDEDMGRCPLVLPQISQDLCASFRQETQIEDVKRLKEARRVRCFERSQRQLLQHQHQLLQSPKMESDSLESRELPVQVIHHGSELQDIPSPRRRETSTAPNSSNSAVLHLPVPWSGINLTRRSWSRRKPVTLNTRIVPLNYLLIHDTPNGLSLK